MKPKEIKNKFKTLDGIGHDKEKILSECGATPFSAPPQPSAPTNRSRGFGAKRSFAVAVTCVLLVAAITVPMFAMIVNKPADLPSDGTGTEGTAGFNVGTDGTNPLALDTNYTDITADAGTTEAGTGGESKPPDAVYGKTEDDGVFKYRLVTPTSNAKMTSAAVTGAKSERSLSAVAALENESLSDPYYEILGIVDTRVKEAEIPAEFNGTPVADIADDALYDIHFFASLTVNENNEYFKFYNGAIYSKDGKTMYYQSASNVDSDTYRVPEGVEIIAPYAFSGNRFNHIFISSGVKYISILSLLSVKLEGVTVDTNNGYYKSIDGVLFSKDGATLYLYPMLKAESEYIIPDGVINIKEMSFHSMSLARITLPDSVVNIEKNAFSCTELEYINVPKNVANIGDGAFLVSFCRSLSEISVDPENKSYKAIDGVLYTVDGKELLAYPGGKTNADFTVPNGVEKIGYKAFYANGNLTNITLNEELSVIGEGAFQGCYLFTNINFPNSITQIGRQAFKDCRNLMSVTLPSGLTEIEDGVFSGCSSLDSVIFSSGILKIGNSAFSGCFSLTNVTFPEGLTSIGNWAFYSCHNITNIYIPSGVTYIGIKESDTVREAFEDCKNLNSIDVDDGNAVYKSIDGILFSKDGKTIIAFPSVRGGEYSIPSGVTRIENGAFANGNITSITVPDGLTHIGDYAFSGCRYLTEIKNLDSENLDSVISIGKYAFLNCNYLGDIILSENVIFIGDGAFGDCGLFNIVIPNSVITMGKYLFEGCGSLQSVTLSENFTTIAYGSFWGCVRIQNILIPNGVTVIGRDAFRGCSLTTISIPNTVVKIEKGAFDTENHLSKIKVNYAGTQSEWDKIIIEKDNDKLKNAEIIFLG